MHKNNLITMLEVFNFILKRTMATKTYAFIDCTVIKGCFLHGHSNIKAYYNMNTVCNRWSASVLTIFPCLV